MKGKSIEQLRAYKRKLENERKTAIQEGWQTDEQIEEYTTKIEAIQQRIENFHLHEEDDDEGNGSYRRQKTHRKDKRAYS